MLRKKHNNEEEQIQKAVVDYLKILKAQKKIITFFAPVNENKHSYQNRKLAQELEAKAKAMGKRKGVSDLVILLKDKVVFLELKTKKGRLQNSQIEFLGEVNECDAAVGVVAYGFDAAKDVIDNLVRRCDGIKIRR